MKCPKCGNDYCKMISKSQTTGTDYSICHGLLGELCLGPAGFMCGFSNSRNKDVDAYWVCEKCGQSFKA